MDRLTGLGVWANELRYGDAAEIPEAAAELEGLGYTALWVPDVGGDLFPALDLLLGATSTITVATGILNVWMHTPQEVADWWHALASGQRDRLLLGLGVSHGALIGEKWGSPLAVMSDYLDGLEAAGVPLERTCLAALGPKMLELAATRTAGAHTYLVTPEHTAEARRVVGDGFIGAEQGVVLGSDRDAARGTLQIYGTLPNYARNWQRLGFSRDEVEACDDRLVDALIPVGDVDAARDRIAAHLVAGADHVCVQVVLPGGAPMPREQWRLLAPGR